MPSMSQYGPYATAAHIRSASARMLSLRNGSSSGASRGHATASSNASRFFSVSGVGAAGVAAGVAGPRAAGAAGTGAGAGGSGAAPSRRRLRSAARSSR